MGQSPSIQTRNSSRVRTYHVSEPLVDSGRLSYLDAAGGRAGKISGVAEIIAGFAGVQAVIVGRNDVRVLKADGHVWEQIDPLVLDLLECFGLTLTDDIRD
jgi:hypothetical protein